MKPAQTPPPSEDVSEEVAALITTLHETQQRLEVLTEGEVDSVADRDGRTFLLRRAQEQLRHSEAAKQAAILNALPTHIALLDPQGVIVSVNEAWRQFTCTDAVPGPGHAVDLNYPELCDSAWGDGSAEAHQVAAGVRSVLAGAAKSFSTEFTCQLTNEQQGWLSLTVTPLADDRPGGAIVMLSNVTERKKIDQELKESERRFSDILDNVDLLSLMVDREAKTTYCNDYFLRLTGWQRGEVIGKDFFALFTPPDLADELRQARAARLANPLEARHYENDILTRSGDRRLIRWNNTVLRSGAGEVIGTASIGEDITERSMAEEVLKKRAAELERFHRLSVGRELQMVELKKRLNQLAEQAGQELPYDLGFLDPEPPSENAARESTT